MQFKCKAGGKLSTAQYSQGILRKGMLVHVAQYPRRQIRLTVEMIDDLTAQCILHHRIDGEVPPPRRLPRADKGIHRHGEIPMTGARLPFTAGQGDVQRMVLQHIDAKAFAHLFAPSESVQNALQRRRRDAVHLNVDILAFRPHQPIPHTAADKVDSAAQRRRLLRYFLCKRNIVHTISFLILL